MVAATGVQNFIWANRYAVGQGWGSAASIDSGDIPGQIDFSFVPRIGLMAVANGIAVWTRWFGPVTGIGLRAVPGERLPVPVGSGSISRHDLAVNATGNAVLVSAGAQ